MGNGVPGPGAYNGKDHYPVPGFRIVPHSEISTNGSNDDKQEGGPVGP